MQKPPSLSQRWLCFLVGVGRLELPTPRPPDAYSNLAELHPDESMGVGVSVGVHTVCGWGMKCVFSGANLIISGGSASHMVTVLCYVDKGRSYYLQLGFLCVLEDLILILIEPNGACFAEK